MHEIDFSSVDRANQSRLVLAYRSASLLASVAYHPSGSEEEEIAAAQLCKITSALVGGLAVLAKTKNAYCVAAIARQLVEVEYLMYAFYKGHRAFKEWFQSSKKERLNSWSPRHFYNIPGSPFSKEEYGDHCDFGGHPTPNGVKLTAFSDSECEELFCEALQHVHKIMLYLHKWIAENYPVRGTLETNEWANLGLDFQRFFKEDPTYKSILFRFEKWTLDGQPRK